MGTDLNKNLPEFHHSSVIGTLDPCAPSVDLTTHFAFLVCRDVAHHPEYPCEVALLTEYASSCATQRFRSTNRSKLLTIVCFNYLESGFNTLDSFL